MRMILHGASAHLSTLDQLKLARATLCQVPVLTLREPYASLVAWGVKSIETRKVRTSHRGLLAIHAGIGAELPCQGGYRLALSGASPAAPGLGDSFRKTRGRLLAVVRVLDVRDLKPEDEGDACFYEPGRKAWILAPDVVRVKPKEHRGSQGFSYVDAAWLEPETAT